MVHGSIITISGPMGSGKTRELTAYLSRAADVGLKTLYINSNIDTRDSGNKDKKYSTHSSVTSILSPLVDTVKCDTLADVNITGYKVIGIDECQFYTDLYQTVCKWVSTNNVLIVCAGLIGDAYCRPFGQLLQLFPRAKENKECKAECWDCIRIAELSGNLYELQNNGHFTYKIGSKYQDLTDVCQQIDVGSEDKYLTLCENHYYVRMS